MLNFDVHKEQLRGKRWLWRCEEGLKAASKVILQRREAKSGPSIGQSAMLRRGSEEDLDDYCIGSQKLMTWLSEAAEAITETLFNALLINRLPDSYEQFVAQENFQPAKMFPELRTRLRNYDDSRKAA